MEKITVNSKLNKFCLINKIKKYSSDQIEGIIEFYKSDNYLAIESVAQLSALHVRKKNNFEKHAFLLKINKIKYANNNNLNGEYLIYAKLISSSDTSFLYYVCLRNNNELIIEGHIIIGTIKYNSSFEKMKLQDHYKGIYKCLLKNIEKN